MKKRSQSWTRTTLAILAFGALAITGPLAGGACGGSGGDIVDTAVAAGDFETLVTAVKAAGLVETLKGDGPFTVFAPTDEAFAKLPEGTLQALLEDKEQLTAILTYHVVPGRVMSSEVVKLNSAKTVEGQAVVFNTSSGVMVNDASVVQADIVASNGVIHVIDTVLIPQ